MTRKNTIFTDKRILIIFAAIVITLIGWIVLASIPRQTNDASINQSQQHTEPITIRSANDLDTALNELDSVEVNDSDSAELDEAANQFGN